MPTWLYDVVGILATGVLGAILWLALILGGGALLGRLYGLRK